MSPPPRGLPRPPTTHFLMLLITIKNTGEFGKVTVTITTTYIVISCVPGSVLRTLRLLNHLILFAILKARTINFHFTDEETKEVQRK